MTQPPYPQYPYTQQRPDRDVRNLLIVLSTVVVLLAVGVGGSVIQLSCSKTEVITCSNNPFTGQPNSSCTVNFHGNYYSANNGERVVIEGHQNLWDKLLGGTCSEENIYQA